MRLLLCVAVVVGLCGAARAQTQWGFALPPVAAPLAGGGFATGFESGALPGSAATTCTNVATGQADVDAWCRVSTGVLSVTPEEGTYELEMGLAPNTAHGWHEVRNAVVLAFDGAGHGGPFELRFRFRDLGESTDPVDGVWLSGNGVDWFHVTGVDGQGAAGTAWPSWGDGSGQWGSVAFDLAAAAGANGVSLGGTFWVAIAEQGKLPLGFFDGVLIDALELDHDPWLDLGQGLAGTAGLPVLTGDGTLFIGQPVVLTIQNGRPGASATLIVGLSEAPQPFFGGTLVPSPDVVIPGLPLDGSGGLVLAAPWPAGVLAGVEITFQVWIDDPGGPEGYAATNALRATTP